MASLLLFFIYFSELHEEPLPLIGISNYFLTLRQ